MAATIISDRKNIRFSKAHNLDGDPIIYIDFYGGSFSVISTKTEADRLVEALTRAAHTIHKVWSKDLE